MKRSTPPCCTRLCRRRSGYIPSITSPPPPPSRRWTRISRSLVIAHQPEYVRCRHGLQVVPDCILQEAPALDLLIVPGGLGARTHARENPQILEFVRRQREHGSFCLHGRTHPCGCRYARWALSLHAPLLISTSERIWVDHD